jgi:hypothetical protein
MGKNSRRVHEHIYQTEPLLTKDCGVMLICVWSHRRHLKKITRSKQKLAKFVFIATLLHSCLTKFGKVKLSVCLTN